MVSPIFAHSKQSEGNPMVIFLRIRYVNNYILIYKIYIATTTRKLFFL